MVSIQVTRRDTIKQKVIFKVDSDTGVAFRNVAEFLNIKSDELFEELMREYVRLVRQEIMEFAEQYQAVSFHQVSGKWVGIVRIIPFGKWAYAQPRL